jgi:hypothetical protein
MTKMNFEDSARSSLNSIYKHYFEDNDLGSLKMAIDLEKSIISNGYLIEYEIVKKNSEIRRAGSVTKNEKKKKQKITIFEKYGHVLAADPVMNEELRKEKHPAYNKGKLVYNWNIDQFGLIFGYYLDNSKTIMRYSVEYIKGNANEGLVLSTSAWNEPLCNKPMSTRRGFINHLEEMIRSHKNPEMLSDKLSPIETKINLLGFKEV